MGKARLTVMSISLFLSDTHRIALTSLALERCFVPCILLERLSECSRALLLWVSPLILSAPPSYLVRFVCYSFAVPLIGAMAGEVPLLSMPSLSVLPSSRIIGAVPGVTMAIPLNTLSKQSSFTSTSNLTPRIFI